MMGRSYLFSTVTAWAFMETSSKLVQVPKMPSAITDSGSVGAMTGNTTAAESPRALTDVTARLPNRPTSQPAAGSARTAPTAVESRTNPSPPSVIPSLVLRSGICGTQLAKTTPFTKKHSDTAPRARAREGAGSPRTVIAPTKALACLAILGIEADEAVDGERAGAASQEEDEDGAPHEMLGPCLRVDEELGGHDHAEQGQRRQPGGQPEHEQYRAAELEGRGHGSRDLVRKPGELVLVAEQRDRGLPSTDLLEAGPEEDAGDGQPEEQLLQAQGKAAEKRRDCGHSCAQAGGANHGARG